MDTLILCGGFATRLEPITLFVPKPLLPIRGKPIIDHIMENVSRQNPEKIVLSTNRKFSGQFRHWMHGRGSRKLGQSMGLVVEPTMSHGEKFGAIKGITYAIEHADLNDDLLVIAGDNYFSFDLGILISAYLKTRKPTIAVHNIKSLDEAKRFGVVELEGNRVKNFEEKPENPKSMFVSTGIYVLPKETLFRFAEYISDGNNPDAPGYFLQWLINKETIHSVVYADEWYDIGALETYKEVFNRYQSAGTESYKTYEEAYAVDIEQISHG